MYSILRFLVPYERFIFLILGILVFLAIYFGIKYKGRESVWGEDLKKIPKEEKNR